MKNIYAMSLVFLSLLVSSVLPAAYSRVTYRCSDASELTLYRYEQYRDPQGRILWAPYFQGQLIGDNGATLKTDSNQHLGNRYTSKRAVTLANGGVKGEYMWLAYMQGAGGCLYHDPNCTESAGCVLGNPTYELDYNKLPNTCTLSKNGKPFSGSMCYGPECRIVCGSAGINR